MTLVSVVSARSGAGVTTAALALALGWPTDRAAWLVELDPLGGDMSAGFLGAAADQRRGVIEWLAGQSARSGDLGRDLPAMLQPLPSSSRVQWLRGLDGPQQAASVPWQSLGEVLSSPHLGVDVIADLGAVLPWEAQRRAGVDTSAVWLASDVTLLVVPPTLPAVRLAGGVIEGMRAAMMSLGRGVDALGLLLNGAGPYGAREISAQLGVPVVGVLPVDASAAGVLSWGAVARGNLHRSKLLRSARTLAQTAASIADQRRVMSGGAIS